MDYKNNIDVAGTEWDPYTNLENGFDKISLLISNKFNETIFVFLMDSYYYFLSSQQDSPKEYFNTANNLTIYILPYINKKSINISNLDDIVSHIKIKKISKIRLNIFTPNFFFRIDNIHLVMLNIEFYGGDLMIYNWILKNKTNFNFEKMTNFIRICYMNPNGCCSLIDCPNYKIDKKFCLYNSKAELTKHTSNFLILFQLSDNNFFDLESKSQLIILNVDFKYIKFSSCASFFYYSLIEINSKSATVVINEVNLEKNLFPSGLLEVNNINNAFSTVFFETQFQAKIYITNLRVRNYKNDKISEIFSQYNLFMFNLYSSEIYFQNVSIEYLNFIQSNKSKISIENLTIKKGIFNEDVFFFDSKNSIYLNNITISNYIVPTYHNLFICFADNKIILNNSQFNNITLGYFLWAIDHNNISIINTVFHLIEISNDNFLRFDTKNIIYLNKIIILNMNHEEDKSLIEFQNSNKIYIFQSNFTKMINTVSSSSPFQFKINNWITMKQSYFNQISSVGKFEKASYSFILVERNVLFSYGNVFNNCSTIKFDYSNEIVINHSIFFNFGSKNEGGVFNFYYSNNLNMFNCSFSENFANTGGALWLGYYNEINIFNSSFNQLFSKICGGIAYLNFKNILILYTSQFYNTTSNLEGGMKKYKNAHIYFYNKKVII